MGPDTIHNSHCILSLYIVLQRENKCCNVRYTVLPVRCSSLEWFGYSIRGIMLQYCGLNQGPNTYQNRGLLLSYIIILYFSLVLNFLCNSDRPLPHDPLAADLSVGIMLMCLHIQETIVLITIMITIDYSKEKNAISCLSDINQGTQKRKIMFFYLFQK